MRVQVNEAHGGNAPRNAHGFGHCLTCTCGTSSTVAYILGKVPDLGRYIKDSGDAGDTAREGHRSACSCGAAFGIQARIGLLMISSPDGTCYIDENWTP